MLLTTTSKKLRVNKNNSVDIIRSVKIFFGIRVRATYNKSRIIRKPTKAYEEFIFKGYDQQSPGFSKPGSFKEIKWVFKN